MAVTTIARIQHRRGVKSDLPETLNEGELGWCLDTRELFIGNSPAVGGNTQILTTASNLAAIAQYTFVSDTSVASVTGSSAAQPVVRSLQNQIDDYWVNVKAYGAAGDGITDDTAAINRAISDLYTKILTTAESALQTQKAIWFPSGTYRITSAVKVYPGVRLVGEHSSAVNVHLDNNVVAQPCVLRLVDSLGQEDTAIGNNGADLPVNIFVEQITFSTSNDETILLLQRCEDITFDSCVFRGNWAVGDGATTAQKAVNIQTLGSSVTTQNIQFNNCVFEDVVYAIYCNDPARSISCDRSLFRDCYRSVFIGDVPYLNGPFFCTISNSVFRDIDDRAIYVQSINPGVSSINNVFDNVGELPGSVVQCIFWDVGTTLCTSVNDRFSRLGNPPATARIFNANPSSNMILNAQDSFNQPVP